MVKIIVIAMMLMLTGVSVAGQEEQGFYNEITLVWDANTEHNLDGYNIYVGVKSGGPYNLIGTNGADDTEFTWFNLPDNSDRFFVVIAFNNEGLESGYSNEVCGYADENHDYGIDCNDDYYTDKNNDDNSGDSGCFVSTIRG